MRKDSAGGTIPPGFGLDVGPGAAGCPALSLASPPIKSMTARQVVNLISSPESALA